MSYKIASMGFALVLAASYSLTALSQQKPDTLVKQRQAVMTLQGKYYYGQLNRMVQGRIPYDASVAARAAGFLDALSKMPWEDFPPETKGVKSEALPAVFTDTAKFKEAQDRLQSEVSKLVAATKGGSEAAVKTQIMAVGKACDSCHDSFRENN